MKIIIETPRLILRQFELEDSAPLYKLNSDLEVIRHTGNPPFANIQEAEDCITQTIFPQYLLELGRWAVVLKTSGELIGWCGLKYRKERDEIDLGYRFLPKHWGQGIATEASFASLEYGFKTKKLDRIIGCAMKENLASIRVLEKVGLKYVKDVTLDGEDCVYHAITKEDYMKRN